MAAQDKFEVNDVMLALYNVRKQIDILLADADLMTLCDEVTCETLLRGTVTNLSAIESLAHEVAQAKIAKSQRKRDEILAEIAKHDRAREQLMADLAAIKN